MQQNKTMPVALEVLFNRRQPVVEFGVSARSVLIGPIVERRFYITADATNSFARVCQWTSSTIWSACALEPRHSPINGDVTCTHEWLRTRIPPTDRSIDQLISSRVKWFPETKHGVQMKRRETTDPCFGIRWRPENGRRPLTCEFILAEFRRRSVSSPAAAATVQLRLQRSQGDDD